jgi:hypothetical protein
MACPAVSGTVALLNTYAEAFIPNSTPEDYKQALTSGAEWLPGYEEYDQGAGFLNAYNALVSLVNDPSIGDIAPPLSPTAGFAEWIQNIEFGNGCYDIDIVDLAPGHNREFIFMVDEHTPYIELEITDLDLGIDLGLNSFEVYIQSAKRSGYWYFIESANVWDDALFHVDDYETWWTGDVSGVYTDPWTRLTSIEPGYVKIIIENDWTSFDSISGHIRIRRPRTTTSRRPDFRMQGAISEYETIGWLPIEIPEDTDSAEIKLSWMRDWRGYPTSDLDMIIANWAGDHWEYIVTGATLNSPERVIIQNPTAFYVLIIGYSIYEQGSGAAIEPYKLHITFTGSSASGIPSGHRK